METDRPTWRSRAWLVAAVVLFVLTLVLASIGIDRPAAAWAAVAVAASVAASVILWAVHRTRRQRRDYEAELAAWAAERATQTERLRIASDLHDIVSHGLGLITVRAAAARATTARDADDEPTRALADIERASRATTTELRRMLTLLRAPGTAPLHPADTLDDLPAIVDAATSAGLTASLCIGELGDVSAGAQLTVCAVVREALHNALRHAGPTLVRVDVRRDGREIAVEVQDAGPRAAWTPQPGAGHGIPSLRERVAVLGGTLAAGPRGDGFGLAARIPDSS